MYTVMQLLLVTVNKLTSYFIIMLIAITTYFALYISNSNASSVSIATVAIATYLLADGLYSYHCNTQTSLYIANYNFDACSH